MTHSDALAVVLAQTNHLFFDFDGPICSIFANYAADDVADELRFLLDRIGAPVSEMMSGTSDPLEVLRQTNALGREEWTRQVADALRDAEIQASKTAKPTPGVSQALAAAVATGRRLAVVSNNSTQAIVAFLMDQRMSHYFVSVIGRYDGMAPSLLKPSPHLVETAINETGARIGNVVLIGDSISDVRAAEAASIPAIGFRRNVEELHRLSIAGAAATFAAMDELTTALAISPPPTAA